ncbi:MAG: hypothetical protein OXU61_13170 [Gammaproteobacteria bacterium]|nr:hypothetical protein [Gammaproteobacteria bacterium]
MRISSDFWSLDKDTDLRQVPHRGTFGLLGQRASENHRAVF